MGCPCRVKYEETVANLKRVVERKTGVPADKQQLFWHHKELTAAYDEKTLLDMNLHTGFSLKGYDLVCRKLSAACPTEGYMHRGSCKNSGTAALYAVVNQAEMSMCTVLTQRSADAHCRQRNLTIGHQSSRHQKG